MLEFASLPKIEKTALLQLEDNQFYRTFFEAILGNRKRPFMPSQVMAIYEKLCETQKLRDLVLFTLGIDIMCRCSDILSMKVNRVQDSQQNILKYLSTKQKKTKKPTACVLTESTRSLLKMWIERNKLKPDDYLFAGKIEGSHLKDRRHRDIIKEWAILIGLPPEYYSTHSMRKTKSILMYVLYKDPEAVRQSLGQESLLATQAYLGVDLAHALNMSQQIDLFDMETLFKYDIIQN